MSNSKEIFKEGDDVYCHLRGHGFVYGVGIESIDVEFKPSGNIYIYKKDGRPNGVGIINPTLSHTHYTLDGFSQKQSIKKDQVIFVRSNPNTEWLLRHFVKFGEEGGVYVVSNQLTTSQSGTEIYYKYYSIENPLTK